MAKSRRNRAKGGQRSDPISKPVKPPSDPELAAIREKSILPVLKDLQSVDPKSRTAAAGAIANIIQDNKCRKLLLRERIVHIILNETLTDTSLESRAAGWSILRILAAKEEADFSVHLFRIDVLTALEHACANITKALRSSNPLFSKLPKLEQIFIWSIAESLAAILAAVAEAHDEALDAIVRSEQIVQFLFTLVTHGYTTLPVLNSALWCMMTLSEDNQKFVDAILADEPADQPIKCYNRLIDLKSSDGYRAVLACGVLHNVFSVAQWSDQNPGRDGASDAILVPTLSQIIGRTQLKKIMSNGEDTASPVDVMQLALEILASIGTSLQESLHKNHRSKWNVEKKRIVEDADVAMDADVDEKLSDKDVAGDDEDEEMDEDEMEADMDIVTGMDDNDDEPEGIDDLPTLKELMQKAIPQVVKVSQSCGGIGEPAGLILDHAFTTLNNISWTVSCMDLTDVSNTAILSAWTPVAQAIWQQAIAPVLASDTSDVDLAAIVTSLAWAIARTLHGQNFLSGDEHKKFIALYHASKNLTLDQDDPFQSLGVKCVGVLGQLALAASTPLNREIGIFLLTVVKSLPETPAADAVEALNQLFDIYGDEDKEWDQEVFWKENFLQHLEEAAPRVKTVVKTIDKRKSTELRARAEEASWNLSRFIQYKQKHRP